MTVGTLVMLKHIQLIQTYLNRSAAENLESNKESSINGRIKGG